MKLSEIIDNLDKTSPDYVDIEMLMEEFDIRCDTWIDGDDTRLTSYFIHSWLCTDTHVGLRVYFLDDEFVAVSFQSARKNAEVFEWKGQNAFNKVRKYLQSLVKEDIPTIPDLNMDEDCGDGGPVTWSKQLLTDIVIYKGVECKVVETFSDYKDIDNWRYVRIEGVDELVSMEHIKVPFNLKDVTGE